MFYDINVMNSSTLGKVWQASHFQEWNDGVCIWEICEKLDKWIGSNADRPNKRFSLRSSSIFINGVTRMYKEEVAKLFDDCLETDRAMSRRGCLRHNEVDYSSDTVSTECTQNGRKRSHSSNSSSGTKKSCTQRKEKTLENNSNKTRSKSTREESVDNKNSKKKQNSRSKSKAVESPNSFDPNRRERDRNSIFDKNLPFGFVAVYDTYDSRIPSKIIFSSLSDIVTDL